MNSADGIRGGQDEERREGGGHGRRRHVPPSLPPSLPPSEMTDWLLLALCGAVSMVLVPRRRMPIAQPKLRSTRVFRQCNQPPRYTHCSWSSRQERISLETWKRNFLFELNWLFRRSAILDHAWDHIVGGTNRVARKVAGGDEHRWQLLSLAAMDARAAAAAKTAMTAAEEEWGKEADPPTLPLLCPCNMTTGHPYVTWEIRF